MQEISQGKKKILTVLAGALILFLLVLTVSGVMDIINKIKKEPKYNIVVSDTGEVYAPPDLAIVDLAVINESQTVADATAENSDKMNKITDEMKSLGIEEKDLKTVSFNIYPLYDYVKGERIFRGYQVTQSLEVKIRNLDNISQVLQKATDAGANDVGNLQFTIDNQDDLKNQARQQAIDRAKGKAEQMASELGVRLGKVTNFSENFYVPYYGAVNSAAKGMGGAETAPVPNIQAGENKISVSVTITYEIY
jgi:uncharacterized protein